MAMAQRNIIAGLALITLGVWYVYLIGNLPTRSIMPNTPGPAFFPTVIVSAVLLLSTSLLVSGIIGLRKDTNIAAGQLGGKTAIFTLIVFAVYLVILPWSGFILASIPFFAALMFFYGSRKPLVIGTASIMIPIIVFLIFRYAFQIILPRGILAF